MPKSVHDDVLDAALDEIALATQMTCCSQEPATRTEAITAGTYMLASVTLTAGDGNGDYTVTIGDTDGQKLIVGVGGNTVTVSSTGDPDHVALCDATRLLYVTTCTVPGNTITATNDVTFPAWDIEIADPT